MLAQLPVDVLKYHIFPQLDPTTSFILQFVSRLFYKLNRVTTKPDPITLLTDIALATWGKHLKIKYGSHVWRQIIDASFVENKLIVWLLRNSYFSRVSTTGGYIFAYIRKLEYVPRGRNGERELDIDIIKWYAKRGLGAIKYLWRKDPAFFEPNKIFVTAAREENYSVMRYLLKQQKKGKYTLSNNLFNLVLPELYDQIEVLEWLIGKGIMYDSDSTAVAKQNGRDWILSWLETLGLAPPPEEPEDICHLYKEVRYGPSGHRSYF
jgi:hypothetical protein